MFEALTERLGGVFAKLGKRGRLTEGNIRQGLREIRLALLEADVHYEVVGDFIDKVSDEAVGERVIRTVHPDQQIVKIVHDTLVEVMGPSEPGLRFAPDGITVVMLAGLQGSGKTTTCAKLARLVESKGRQPMMVAADVYRPAAVQQLAVLGEQTGISVYREESKDPVGICKRAVKQAKSTGRDVVILDTAGRLHIDDEMMLELEQIHKAVQPHEILLVCDAMTGQDAVSSARVFSERLDLDGIILTKLDGDARGGAALSAKAVTGKPIRFVGVGEKLDRLEEFHAERMAGRILGMGDVVSLVEKAQETIAEEEAQKLQEKLLKNAFTLTDFMEQIERMRKMGPIKEILGMIPGMGGALKGMDIDEGDLDATRAMIESMTPTERDNPEIISGSRRVRIAKGSGTDTAQVGDLLKQFKQLRTMMKKFSPEAVGQAVLGVGGPGGRVATRTRRSKPKLDRKALKKRRKRGRRHR